MIFNIKPRQFYNYIMLPSETAGEFLRLSDEKQLKVLIYLYSSNFKSFSDTEAAKALGLSENDIREAVSVLNSKGLIDCSDETLSTLSKVLPSQSRVVEQKVHAENPSARMLSSKTVVKLSPKDIASLAETDAELNHLFDEAQIILKRPINYTEQGSLINLYQYYRFPVNSIELILSYCEEMGKTSFGYIEAVATGLHRSGIVSFHDVDVEIERLRKNKTRENQVARALGLTAKVTPKQSKYIEKWAGLGFSNDMITLASEKCIDSTNKLSFQYMDKILVSWAENGIYTPEAAENAPKPEKKKGSKNKSSDKERSYNLNDFDDFILHSKPTID